MGIHFGGAIVSILVRELPRTLWCWLAHESGWWQDYFEAVW